MLVFLLFGESAENPPSLGNIEVLIRVFIRKISIKLYMPFLFREGNGSPLQYTYLENPME